MKKITTIVLSGTVALFLSACGGGSSSTPPLYSTLQDLEFKTLNMKEIWYVNGRELYTTMKFTNNYSYGSDGTQLLIDDTSSAYYAKGCVIAPAGGVVPNGAELTYLCMGVFRTGGVAGWGLSIDNGGIISGNFHYSSSGDAGAVGAALISPSTAYARVEGGVSNTVATSNLIIASADGVGVGSVPEISESNIDDDINQEEAYLDTASDAPQTQAKVELSAETIQTINVLKEALLQVQSE